MAITTIDDALCATQIQGIKNRSLLSTNRLRARLRDLTTALSHIAARIGTSDPFFFALAPSDTNTLKDSAFVPISPPLVQAGKTSPPAPP